MQHGGTQTTRYTSLDGLRGVAALVVLVSHALLTSPVLADAIHEGRPEDYSAGWWMTYTPLRLIWGGTEAVYIFFVLSGFVLTGPALKAGFSWAGYYRQRLPRLYLPVWGSLLFAAALLALIPRRTLEGASWWTNEHLPVPVHDALFDAVLLGPVSTLNAPLWSLTWEVWFSLLLPLYVLAARWTRDSALRAGLFLGGAFGLMALTALTGLNGFRFLPIFALGVLMFVHRETLFALGRKLDRVKGGWPALTAAALLLLVSHWLVQASDSMPARVVSGSLLIQVVGAALIVFVVLCWKPAASRFENQPIQWLGSRSFSLYLIHDPIVGAVAFLLGGQAHPLLTLALALPLSLAAAELFFRAVERPSHKMARRLGRRPGSTKAALTSAS